MILFLLLTFFAGMLTVFAPCVIALLPVIIGGSVSGDVKDKKRPIIIVASLAVSLLVFTLLLKATTIFINIPPESIYYISGSIIIALGVLTLFPTLYARVIGKLGIESRAQKTLSKGYNNKSSYKGPIIIGAALGPVFSSCSPVYAYLLATVLPVNFVQAMIFILSYILGLSIVLLLIGYFGQRFVSKTKFASDPNGKFQRGVAILFIIVGLLIFTGYDKKVQTYISQNTPFDFDGLSAQLIPGDERSEIDGVLNLEPYAAPEFTGLGEWINSDPLTLESLKGKVVLVDFWTYSCINCIRNNPYLEAYYQRYKDDGLVVIGLHAPEFAFEKNVENVRKAVKDQNINYPVALDNNFATWNAYENRFWPAAYFIDGEGNVRRLHTGEGEYSESETAIRALLTENGANLSDDRTTEGGEQAPVTDKQTPETYMGTKRASNYKGTPALGAALVSNFTFQDNLEIDQWSLSGQWEVGSDKITAKENAKLRFRIASKETYFVASNNTSKPVAVKYNGQPISLSMNSGQDVNGKSEVDVSESKLYWLVSNPSFVDDYVIELQVPAGVSINVFTFGS
jgi:cytochrome c biogenesis protein CcdA/thiol-disulfide isomerase/thioredoxin